ALLSAAGLSAADLGEAREEGLAAAIAALEAGRLDGFVATIHAPAPQIQRLAAEGRIRLLGLDEATIARLKGGEPYLVPLRLPLGTYPGVPEPIVTVAVAALLAANLDLPAGEVDALLRAIFGQIDFARSGSAAGSQIAARTARDGLSIPLHDAAEVFLNRSAAK
ncbi:MAG TPA: TAXI family TRAP transporter solute-binding subunit, partial [Rhodocyclaceae bacterium]|nr:TAXI family TRAP transporter solute-binding subunit [Rhodocyclaceae bacterium]